jgi:hypothetical protein
MAKLICSAITSLDGYVGRNDLPLGRCLLERCAANGA